MICTRATCANAKRAAAPQESACAVAARSSRGRSRWRAACRPWQPPAARPSPAAATPLRAAQGLGAPRGLDYPAPSSRPWGQPAAAAHLVALRLGRGLGHGCCDAPAACAARWRHTRCRLASRALAFCRPPCVRVLSRRARAPRPAHAPPRPVWPSRVDQTRPEGLAPRLVLARPPASSPMAARPRRGVSPNARSSRHQFKAVLRRPGAAPGMRKSTAPAAGRDAASWARPSRLGAGARRGDSSDGQTNVAACQQVQRLDCPRISALPFPLPPPQSASRPVSSSLPAFDVSVAALAARAHREAAGACVPSRYFRPLSCLGADTPSPSSPIPPELQTAEWRLRYLRAVNATGPQDPGASGAAAPGKPQTREPSHDLGDGLRFVGEGGKEDARKE